jgi:Na+-driven multidrug efflux pump
MSLEEITLTLFAACHSFRVVAYVPQILKAAGDKNGASSISFMTWFLFLLAHLSTVAYALVNRSDWGLAACFAINAVCCITILAIAYWKRRRHAKRLCHKGRPAFCVAA